MRNIVGDMGEWATAVATTTTKDGITLWMPDAMLPKLMCVANYCKWDCGTGAGVAGEKGMSGICTREPLEITQGRTSKTHALDPTPQREGKKRREVVGNACAVKCRRIHYARDQSWSIQFRSLCKSQSLFRFGLEWAT